MIREFLDWWFSQLKAVLPENLVSRLRQELCLLYLDVEREHVAIHARFKGQDFDFGKLDYQEIGEESQEVQHFIKHLPRRPDRIMVRIGKGRYLAREVELPLAAEHNLGETINYQLEQLTPFTPEKVICFSGIKERMPEEKKLRAWLAVTPVEQVDEILQTLGQAPPTPVQAPRAAPAEGEWLEILFRPYGQTDSSSYRGRLLLTLVFLLLFGAVFSLHLFNRMQTRDYLRDVVGDVRNQAVEVDRLRAEIDSLREQAAQLNQNNLQAVDVMVLWDDLTQRLDDDTWLQRIDLRDRQLTLQGVSSNAASLIGQLESSPHLGNVRYGSSVTRDRSSDKERFNISATVEVAPLKPGGNS